MDATTDPRTDFDTPWKELLEHHFRTFMEFFFPAAAADIDWSRGHTFLDKELAQVVRDAELGRRFVDKLVAVWRHGGGDETWVLVHVEVRSHAESGFAKRMFVYNYRLFDRYDRPVASLAVLADDTPGWRPQGFHHELWGSRTGLSFPVAKLLDYADRPEELERDPNPFAWAVAAHLRTLATRGDPEGRLGWKLRLAKLLYERGYKRQDILDFYAFIDWLMALPKGLELRFHQGLKSFEEEKKMRYVTSAERIGREQGIQQGIRQGIQQGIQQKAHAAVFEVLEARFRVVSQALVETLGQFKEEAVLSMLLKRAVVTPSLEDFAKDVQRALS